MRENLPCLYGIKAGVALVWHRIGAGCQAAAGLGAGLGVWLLCARPDADRQDDGFFACQSRRACGTLSLFLLLNLIYRSLR